MQPSLKLFTNVCTLSVADPRSFIKQGLSVLGDLGTAKHQSHFFHISIIFIIILLNNSIYSPHSQDGAITATTDDDTDTDNDDDTLSTSNGVKSFRLHRLLSVSLPYGR